MVGAVHNADADRHGTHPAREVEPGEAAAHDHDVGSRRHSRIVSRRQRANPMTSATGGTAASSPYAVYMRQRRYSRSGSGRNGGERHQRDPCSQGREE